MKAILALEDGRIFPCRSFTGPGETGGEVVFNTSMTGYQEVLTDPSYRGQMVTMTYPLIGNYGVCPEDVESDRIQVEAFIVREYQRFPSNYRSTETLGDYLKKQGVLGVEEIDTRALTRHIRIGGAMRAMISTIDLDSESLVRKAKALPSMVGCDLVKAVSCEKAYRWNENGPVSIEGPLGSVTPLWIKAPGCHKVIAYDFGIKYNIIRCLELAGCEVIVVPADTPAKVVRAMEPDGVFLSNGPGDPEPLVYAIDTVRNLLDYKPLFGICLGHQILSLALGGRTYKLKFGHRGGNQPVQNMFTKKVEITSQNHGFAADMTSLGGKDLDVFHMNLNDNTVEGLRHKTLPVFGVQYHPEASPGPHDAAYLFEEFVNMMKKNK
ncbi:MAG: glutamine-hydrolyzing carbamoyl-phosphate synthase small subunit [Proteobacteria bacterium]|nr:glutamine-hydrolyzing carbamoyl-phosphate synthase small subunit [Pseudomonadota bacterium]